MPSGFSDPSTASLPEGANLYLLMEMIEVGPSVNELQRYLSVPGNPTGVEAQEKLLKALKPGNPTGAEAQEKLLEALGTAGCRLFLPSSP